MFKVGDTVVCIDSKRGLGSPVDPKVTVNNKYVILGLRGGGAGEKSSVKVTLDNGVVSWLFAYRFKACEPVTIEVMY